MDYDALRTNFLIPHLYEAPAFYRASEELVLLVTDQERILLNTTTGWGIVAEHWRILGASCLKVEGTAVLCKGRRPGWYGLRRFVVSGELGVLCVLSEDFDLDELSRHILLRACDLNDCDAWDWERGHAAFSGDGMREAAFALRQCLAHGGDQARRYAAYALKELLQHRRHGCFDVEGMTFLRAVPGLLKAHLVREEDAEVRQAIAEALEER